jgi:hypothetical protein
MGSEIITEFVVSEFRGNFPDIPVAPGVDLAELRAMDSDPFFVSLPIVPRVGAVSKNGLLYDEALVSSVEQQINTKRPGGIFGHLKDEDRGTAYPIPSGMWVGAKRDGDQLWAKAYIPPGAARDHIRRLKAVGGQISTSIYGKGKYEDTGTKGVRRLLDFDLESLDFAPPQRAALGHGAVPNVTSEFEQENPGMTKEELLKSLTLADVPANIREQIVSDAQAQSSATQTVAELRTQVSDRDTLITELQTSVAEFRRREFDGAIDTRVAELTNWKITGDAAKAKLDSFRRTLRSRIVSELGAERDADKIKTVIETVWADLQPLAETVRDALAGPPALVSSKVRTEQPKFEDTPEARAKARAILGI